MWWIILVVWVFLIVEFCCLLFVYGSVSLFFLVLFFYVVVVIYGWIFVGIRIVVEFDGGVGWVVVLCSYFCCLVVYVKNN